MHTTACNNIPSDTVSDSQRPLFIRLPKVGNCEWTGLSRSKLNQLILACKENGYRPPVKSVALKPPGARNGVRLIHFDSLIQYLCAEMNGVEGGDR
jgi:hypothetical protein